MSLALSSWARRGCYLSVFGQRVFVMQAGFEHSLPPLLLLHGFPTSSFDFAAAVDRIAQVRPVVAFDHLGFGLSAKPEDYSYSLLEQAEVAVQVWRGLGIEHGHLLAHDYGTSVATELLARRERELLPFRFDSLTLCNGSVHLELAQLTLTQQILRDERAGPLLARLANRPFFISRMRRLFARPDAVSDDELEGMWEALIAHGGRERISAISQYLRERMKFWHRWVGALTRLDLPAHVVWGRHDPVAVPAIAEQLHREIPDARLTWLEDLGHYPQTESAQTWCDAVLPFLAEHDSTQPSPT